MVSVKVRVKEEKVTDAVPGREGATGGRPPVFPDPSGSGLTSTEAERARREHGANQLSEKKQESFLKKFVGNFRDPVIRVLLVALIVNLFLMFRGADYLETIGIGAAVFLATLISTLSEYGSEKAFRRLSGESEKVLCRVLRDGRVTRLPIADIVVGDVVLLGAGDLIPADGYLLSGRLGVDQSSMTGEGREAKKLPADGRVLSPSEKNAVFRGCTVLTGEGRMEVAKVGDATFLGGISREIQLETRESPLRVRLTRLAKQITVLGYTAAVLVGLVYLVNAFVLDSGLRSDVILMKLATPEYVLSNLFRAFTLGLTVVVMAVPEGLPMMVAVVLSANIRKMMRDQVLVRKAVGIEAAGSMNVLFTDKTGTLTEGKLRVTGLLTGDCRDLPPDTTAGEVYRLFALSAFCNTSAERGEENGKPAAVGGNTTDRALLSAVLGGEYPKGVRVGNRIPFDSDRKYSAAEVHGAYEMTLVKGAPEKLLPYVRQYIGTHGKRYPFHSGRFREECRCIASAGKRLIAIACRDGELSGDGDFRTLSLIAVAILEDRVRPEVPGAVGELRGAGIHTVMVTGDGKDTAMAVARACGILSGKTDLCLDSRELAAMSDMALREALPRLAVVARALPADKSRLVRIAGENGMVVGMTGDGINDAPALRAADVGFAMGDGTYVAKEAGDIVILDNNLASIVRAVLYGRTIFKSIRKFITLQLTMNFCAVGVSMLGPFLGVDEPVTVVQMLWINMIMDTLGGLAFAGEAPLASHMKEKPKRRDEPILNRYMAGEIIWLGGFTVAMCMAFLRLPALTSRFRASKDGICLLTAFFALFIFSSVFNCFNARTDRLRLFAGLGKNKVFLGIMAAILAIQIGFVYFGGTVLRTVPLTGKELLLVFVLSLGVFPVEFLRKLFRRMRGRSDGY